MVLRLNRTGNPINRNERNNINENWDNIEKDFNNFVNVLSESAYQQVVDSAKLIWQQPVNTFSDLTTTYPNAQVGWTAWTRQSVNGVSRAYRYNGSQWVEQQQFIGDPINEVDNRLTGELALIETNPTFKTTQTSETPIIGQELLDGANWTSEGWTGDFTTGFTHVVGQTSPLIKNIPSLNPNILYLISITLTDLEPTGGSGLSDFYVSLGGSTTFETYKGTYDEFTFTFGIRPLDLNKDLVITPRDGYTGKVISISLKPIQFYSIPSMHFENTVGESVLEFRASKSPTTNLDLNSIFIGKMSGSRNVEGDLNIGLGNYTLSNNTTGFWSVGIGHEALRDQTVGSRNIAIGRISMAQNITGDRNVAIGTFSLTRNTHGRNNVGIGADALWYNTTGSRNVALGTISLGENRTGEDNFAAGYDALGRNRDGKANVAIGYQALLSTIVNDNVGIGHSAMLNNRLGSNNVAIGRNSLFANTSGNNNIAIGRLANSVNQTGNGNVALGAGTLGGAGGNYNVAIGETALSKNEASNNIALGQNALQVNTTGTSNVSIGQASLKDNLIGSHNIALGQNALSKNGVSHNIALGQNSLSNNLNSADNIGMGMNTLRGLTTGDGNVALGVGALSKPWQDGVPLSMQRNVAIGKNTGAALGDGSNYNTLIGSAAGATLVTGERNILIGYAINTPTPTTSDYLNIGDIIKGDLTTSVVEMRRLRLTNLPTTLPTIPGTLWNDAGTLKIS